MSLGGRSGNHKKGIKVGGVDLVFFTQTDPNAADMSFRLGSIKNGDAAAVASNKTVSK